MSSNQTKENLLEEKIKEKYDSIRTSTEQPQKEEDAVSFKSFTSFVKRERKALAYAVLSHFIWAIGVIFVRTPTRRKNFSANTFVMFRSIGLAGFLYLIMKYKNIPIRDVRTINQKHWFLIRTCGIYFAFLTYLIELLYLRLSTAACLGGCAPFIMMGLSALMLKEKLYMRHIFGMVFCFLGSVLIVSNEKKDTGTKVSDEYNNISFGVFMGVLNFLFWGAASFTQKLFILDKLDTENQIFYIGVTNTILAIICALIQGRFDFDIVNALCGLAHAVIFYFGTLTTDWSLQLMDASKFAPTIYIFTMMVFVVSLAVFKESLYFTDIIGSLFIVSFHVYNAFNPIVPGSK